MNKYHKEAVEKHKIALKLQEIAKIQPTLENKIAASNANQEAIDTYWDHAWETKVRVVGQYSYLCPHHLPDYNIEHSIAALKEDIKAFYKYKSNPKDKIAKEWYKTTSEEVLDLMKDIPIEVADSFVGLAEVETLYPTTIYNRVPKPTANTNDTHTQLAPLPPHPLSYVSNGLAKLLSHAA